MKKLSKISFKLLTIIIGILTISGIALASSAWPCSSTLTDINGGTITEPSDALIYSGYLWIVSDDGHLWRMDLDGTGKIVYELHDVIGYSDYEGLTQKDGYLYVAVEYPAMVFQVFPNTGATDTVAGTYTGSYWDLSATVTTSSTSAGVEAFTSDGTNFYIGMQDDGDVYIFNSSFTYLNKLPTPHAGYTDLSGLYWQNGTFYSLFDSNLRIVLFTVNSTTAPTAFTELKDAGGVNDARYQTPDANWEGIAFDCTNLYIADDGGYIYTFTGFPTITTTGTCTLTTPPATPDYTTISTVVKNRGKTITVTYSKGDTQTITYSAPYTRVRTAITTDYKTLLILDGTTLYVYQNGACVYTFALLTAL